MRARLAPVLILCALIVTSVPNAAGAGSSDQSSPDPPTPNVSPAKLGEIAEYVEARRLDLQLPGVAIGLVHRDEAVFLEGFGTAGDGRSVEPTTPFMIASISKTVTAMAVLQLVDEGVVDLDAPVTQYIPELAPTGDSLKVRDFLHHRTGISTSIGRASWVGEAATSLVANVQRLGPHLASDAEHEYSNANYDVLALVVERASGMSFADYLGTHVYAPLGMTDSTADRSRAEDLGLTQGYYHWLFLGYRSHDARMPPGMAGSATTFSSARDLTHLMVAHMNDGVYQGTRVISSESLGVLHDPRPYVAGGTAGYAGGLRVGSSFPPDVGEELASLTTLWHGGSWSNHQGMMWMMPEADLGFVVLTNGIDMTNDTRLPQVAQGVKYLLFDLEPPEIVSATDFLLRWSKHLLLALVLAQLVLAVVVIGSVRRALRSHRLRGRDWWILGGATTLDLIAVWLMVSVMPSVGESPLGVQFHFPDFRILIIGMSLGVVWGVVRTGLVVFGLRPFGESPGEGTI